MLQHNDILLDGDDDLQIKNGDLVVGDSVIQELDLLMTLNAGEAKTNPILGPSLIRYVNRAFLPSELRARVKLHLAMDGKSYDELQNIININRKTQ